MPQKRVLSLDILRGATVAGMILVNNPGDWGAIYAPLRHAEWNGLTPTDLVFPFFLFMMGMSTYLSFSKQGFRLTGTAVRKIAVRTCVIFGLGLLLNALGILIPGLMRGDSGVMELVWHHVRIPGVLQRLSLAYLAGSLILLGVGGVKKLPWIAAGILIVYSALLFAFDGHALWPDNIIAVVDKAVFGEAHMYREWLPDGGRISFDPEGLLSTVPGVAHLLIGVWCGSLVVNTGERDSLNKTLERLMVAGTVLLFAGLLLGYGEPINKKIWSSTYVLATSGFAMLTLGLITWVADMKGAKRWALPFVDFGMNPLAIYVLASLLAVVLESISVGGTSLKEVIYAGMARLTGGDGRLASLCFALLFVTLNWAVCYWLHRKRIFIKV